MRGRETTKKNKISKSMHLATAHRDLSAMFRARAIDWPSISDLTRDLPDKFEACNIYRKVNQRYFRADFHELSRREMRRTPFLSFRCNCSKADWNSNFFQFTGTPQNVDQKSKKKKSFASTDHEKRKTRRKMKIKIQRNNCYTMI